VNLSDQNTHYPIHYSLGESSERIIIHQQDDLFVAHEHLFQDTTPTRFYHHPDNTFLFIMKGELYLQQNPGENEQETALKKHQGIWLTALTTSTITLLSPLVEICLIRLKKTTDTPNAGSLKKVSSGTVESVLGRNHIKTWSLWQSQSESISLELYPPRYSETLYYQKTATQYLLPLSGTIDISDEKKQPTKCSDLGKVIFKKEPRAVFNPNPESVTVLSITTSQGTKGRVLLLKKPTAAN
jgi:hypothetical protein